ncbi:ATP-dependent zinc protease [Veronia pacifica]|uniref:Ribosomal protein S6 modification protein n=1 Tax=Veronia pacifica TaxID=1080227 RepID=A0A1C3EPE1_9GAMM|nr:RimK/LysX family protein [Veronia pacifica]ODA35101.1 ribosomal protein S6 modification protein [Veronia pacifica]
MKSTDKITLGWREWVTLPDLNLSRIKAKVDTGARTSCLHATNIETFCRDDELWVKFDTNPSQKGEGESLRCEAKVKAARKVKDSGGHQTERYVIETTLVAGKLTSVIEMTLISRAKMKFKMLLGRTAMSGMCTVDPEASFLLGVTKDR